MSEKEPENCNPEQKKCRVDNDCKPDKIQIEERFSYLLKKYPQKTPEHLYDKAVEFSFVTESITFVKWIEKQNSIEPETEQIQRIDDRLQYAMTMLKSANIEELKVKVTHFDFDNSGEIRFKSWIEKEAIKEEKQNDRENIIDSRLQYAATMLDGANIDILKEKIQKFEMSDEGTEKFKSWVQIKVNNQKNQEILEGRYQTLLALFPEKDNRELESKAIEFDFDEKGNEALNSWIYENKLHECGCCFDGECLEKEMLSCPSGHLFCKDCVKRGSESAFGEGKTELGCFHEDCKESFEFKTLESGVTPRKFSKWSLKIQSAEVEKAGVSGLETCPFCHYAAIIENAREDNPTFHCQHPECGKKSCRLCREICHAPLRCDQVEKDEEVKKRIFIENKMSEAMFRRCYKCSKPIIKAGGCNWVQCSCGAEMCYYHQSPKCGHDTCTIRNDNQEERVNMAAKEARNEVNAKFPDVELKIDPTK